MRSFLLVAMLLAACGDDSHPQPTNYCIETCKLLQACTLGEWPWAKSICTANSNAEDCFNPPLSQPKTNSPACVAAYLHDEDCSSIDAAFKAKDCSDLLDNDHGTGYAACINLHDNCPGWN